MAFTERKPGEFWSITVENCFKAFGSNAVMKGLTLAIPEGMITVVLGPSGTGKSVLIKHLIGLMFLDDGDVKVHGNRFPTCACPSSWRCVSARDPVPGRSAVRLHEHL